jgi:hypothetical protein
MVCLTIVLGIILFVHPVGNSHEQSENLAPHAADKATP